jgi:hypothetical protein
MTGSRIGRGPVDPQEKQPAMLRPPVHRKNAAPTLPHARGAALLFITRAEDADQRHKGTTTRIATNSRKCFLPNTLSNDRLKASILWTGSLLVSFGPCHPSDVAPLPRCLKGG